MKRLIMVFTLLAMISAKAFSVETIAWDKSVIRVDLVVGVEQMIHFPEDGMVGLPASLASPNMFRTLYAGKTAYWTALQPFNIARIQVKLDNGEIVLFDVSAKVMKNPPAKVETLNIVKADSPEVSTDTDKEREKYGDATLFELIRYAAQSVYSPERLVSALPGIREVPVGIKGNLNRIYNHQNHFGLIFKPSRSWTVGGLYVTALTVKNDHTHDVYLDNRLVQHTKNARMNGVGQHFLASSFYHRKLNKGGDKNDRTTLFIVTDRPFQASIRI